MVSFMDVRIVVCGMGMVGKAFVGLLVPVKGITGVTPAEIQQAEKEGKIIKLIGKVERKDGKIVASVAPVPLPADHPLASVRGPEKAFRI